MSYWVLRARILVLLALAGAVPALTPGHALAQATCSMRGDLASNANMHWEDLRAACDAEQAAFKQKDPVGFSWFANAANGFSGFPYILQRIMPELAPEIWGRPEESFARFGYFSDPDPTRPLPRGLGIASTAGRSVQGGDQPIGEIDLAKPGLHVVTLSCGSCHTGQVRTDTGIKVIDGAPNTQIDVRKWREAYTLTVKNYLSSPEMIRSTAEKITRIIDSKPDGYFYPKDYFSGPSFLNFNPEFENAQRTAVKANLSGVLAAFACGTADRAAGQELQLETSYGNWNAPGLAGFSTGQQDGSGDLVFQLLVANAMPKGECQPGPGGGLKQDFDKEAFKAAPHPEIPPFATITDIPSVWNQQTRQVAQWDGSVNSAFWRNIAAALPIVGDPSKVDLHNVGIVANFLSGLPPAPYPFDVDMARAVRGEALFKENCTACHKPFNNTLYQYRDIGTDMNRAAVLNEPALKLFLQGFGASCNNPDFRYTPPDGQAVFPCKMSGDEVITSRTTPANQGYVINVLDGIWARAPYLHNGSVPTLYHLLVPDERPTEFLRGSIDYDQRNLGYAWQIAETGRLVNGAPTLMVYDTRRDSRSNAGHDRDIVVDGKLRRLNWSGQQNAEDVKDLIEYLKTQ
jgi:hypothetical protein